MILGIMQPYFWPYFEHFRLLNHCDRWVVFDTVAYARRSWMNRNRLANLRKGWTYLSVPVQRATPDTPVAEVTMASGRWQQDLQGALRVYEHHAPHYDKTMALVTGVCENLPSQRLVDLNVGALQAVCAALGIETPLVRLSELDLSLPAACAPGEWALHIARALGADEYRNPAGGRAIFDAELYRAAGLELSFHEHLDISYDTGPFPFTRDLSILDTMMWVDWETISDWLRR